MGNQSVKKFAVVFGLGLLLLLSGCSSSKNSRTSALEFAHDLLDQKQYSDAVPFLADLLHDYPGDLDVASLLANAHLGRAGIEILPIITAVMGVQDEVPLKLHQEPVCPRGAVENLTELEYDCLIYRFLKRAPAADHPDVLAARDLFRKYFPDAAKQSSSINFVAGFAEAASALSRLKILLNADFVAQMDYGVKVNPKLFPYDPAIHHSKSLISEINWGLERFRGSYSRFTSLVQSLNGQALWKIGSQTLVFDESIKTSDILRFAAAVAQEKTLPLDKYLSEVATENMGEMSAGLLEIIKAASPVPMMASTLGGYALSVHFGNYLAGVLGAMAESLDKDVEVTFFELAWKNPPLIVRNFLAAAEKSWDIESGAPLLSYYDETEAAWMDLKGILNDWKAWLNDDMEPETKSATLSAITADAAPTHEQLLFPSEFDPPQITAWVQNVMGFIAYELTGFGMLPGAPAPSGFSTPAMALLMPTQLTEATVLLERTDVWMTANFYPMKTWVRTY